MRFYLSQSGSSKSTIYSIQVITTEILYLLHSSSEESIKCIEEVKKAAELFDVQFENEVVSAFDLEATILTIQKIVQLHPKDEIYVNITGGTKIMSSAAMLAAYHFGLNSYYVLDKEVEENKGKSIEDCVINCLYLKLILMN